MSESRRQSPLVEHEAVRNNDRESDLSEHKYLGHYNLRGDIDNARLQDVIRENFSLALPKTANTWHGNDQYRICWMGPDEWLLITDPALDDEKRRGISLALQDSHYTFVDISSGQTIIRVQGVNSRSLLNRGCTLDLDGIHTGPDFCAQTLMAKCSVLLIENAAKSSATSSATSSYDIVVRRSFADYLWRWMIHVRDNLIPFDSSTGSIDAI